jgi:hypothetical protein
LEAPVGAVRLWHPTKEIPMKTPYAILIGLALIAAALFFREPSISPAQAGILGDVDGFDCSMHGCAVLHGDQITFVNSQTMEDYYNTGLRGNAHKTGIITNWR